MSNDGLMVRRRIVLAVRATEGTDLEVLSRDLRMIASGIAALAAISPNVLDEQALLETRPNLAFVFAEATSLASASRAIDSAVDSALVAPRIDRVFTTVAFVHDLRFVIETAEPHATLIDMGREGIVADALGFFQPRIGPGRLSILYTGPLLGDDVIAIVEEGLLRAADPSPGAVILSPRSLVGVGIDLSRVSPPSTTTPTSGEHGHDGPANETP